MIRVDYSGLNWKDLGHYVNLTHAKCGGQVMYSPNYKALFCTTCGIWIYLGKGKQPPAVSSTRPATALQALQNLKR